MRRYNGLLLTFILTLFTLSCAPARYILVPAPNHTDLNVYSFESCFVDIGLEIPKDSGGPAKVQLHNKSTFVHADVSFYRTGETSPFFHQLVLYQSTVVKESPATFSGWLKIEVELLGGYAPCEYWVKLQE